MMTNLAKRDQQATRNEHPLQLPIRNALMHRVVSSVLGLSRLRQIYDAWLKSGESTVPPVAARFLDYTLSMLGCRLQWRDQDGLASVPAQGPLIVVANHPLGGLEGMLLSRELLKVRNDTRVLTNELLLRIPEFAELFIGLDVFGSKVEQKNAKGIRAACRHLEAGGALLIFPAGKVAGINIRQRRIEDPQWNKLVGHLAGRYRAACLPLHIDARNSRLFYLTGLIHPKLRALLLARELANKQGRTVSVSVGELLMSRDMGELDGVEATTEFLRLSTDALDPRHSRVNMPVSTQSSTRIATDVTRSMLQQQLKSLTDYRLVDDKRFAVYCAPYGELGCMMKQIAIEREKAFRAAGEGTGRELDSDQFDRHYWHLWAWDKDKNQMVGSYRVGKTDQIIRERGVESLYSHSLYRFNPDFIREIGNSIEVGRSFVALDYQRHPKALDLLWRGIGTFMVQNPGYHTLFGCVCISSEYSVLARAFLADSMMASYSVKRDWRRQVEPRLPLRVSGKPWTAENLGSLGSISIINKLLGNLDKGRRIPILLRHYLALNGRFASFTVNRGLNNSLDGLILVDLRNAPHKYLNRYLGKEGAQRFLQNWQKNVSVA